ncbi:CD4 protein, partial [Grallaria varia]|nr:CD4 protein [Grallaria varia]
EVKSANKQLKVWNFELSDAGIYTCEYGSRKVRISLHVFKLTISLDGHFLQNEVPELTLMHNSSDPLSDLSIRLFNNNNNIVIPETENKSSQKYILKLKKLEATDSGTWLCHVHSDSPVINENISFAVKVLGFRDPEPQRKYATVDSTVILPWHLNFQEIDWKESFTGQLNWKQQESANAHKLRDFNVIAQRVQQETNKSSHFLVETSENTIQVKHLSVHFNHSGQYQCQVAYKERRMWSEIELVVMKVSANPVGPLSKEGKMTLICEASGPLLSNAYLRWERVNGTPMDVKNSKPQEVKLEMNISAAGLWSCHLIENNERKISLHYRVEEAPVWMNYVVTGASVGGSVLVFALVCLCIISGVNWQRGRQRAKRMERARQYLLENKTCQCQQ